MSQTGVDAVVMISNRLAAKDESDEIAIANMRRILDALPGVTFGMYECPHPYRRPLTDGMLEAMAETGRFSFIKDTCCDAALIAHRLKVLDGRIQLFNANAATILDRCATARTASAASWRTIIRICTFGSASTSASSPRRRGSWRRRCR